MRRSNEPRVHRKKRRKKRKIFNFLMGKLVEASDVWKGNASRWYLSLCSVVSFHPRRSSPSGWLFMWRSTSKTCGKKWAQERGTDTQSGTPARSKQGVSRDAIRDFVVFSRSLLGSQGFRPGFVPVMPHAKASFRPWWKTIVKLI